MEISISLIIISLIFASILAANKLRDVTRTKALIEEINQIESGFNSFQASYVFLPGDYPKASSYFGSDAEDDGNGNGVFDNNNSDIAEISKVAEHLFASQIFRKLPREDDSSFRSNSYKTGIFKFTEHCSEITNGLYNNDKHKYSASLIQANGPTTWTPVVSSYTSFNIDNKIDDGKAQSGKIIGFILSADNSSYNCLSAASTLCSTNPTAADYVKTNKNLGCALSLGLNSITTN